jgi:branched-chain amino acid transport system substrate-binding protein
MKMASRTALLLFSLAPLFPVFQAHAQISDDVVKIGILNDQSGVYADYGGKYSVEAARMAIEDFGGTVLNVPVELVTADHQNRPDVGLNIARDWYDNRRVDAIMELTSSSVALAVQHLSREKNRINIVTGAGTTELTGGQCSRTGFHWAYDTRALSIGTAKSLIDAGADTWFFVTADYSFGYSLQDEASRVINAGGGKVLGSVRHPLNASDFSSFVLQAQASKAKVIAFASAGFDTANAIRAARDFNVTKPGVKLASLLFTLSEVHGLGLQEARGLILTEGYYWDLDDESRAFAKRFVARAGRMPNMIHAGTYSAVLQYLKAVSAAGTDQAAAVSKKLHSMPVDDFFGKHGFVQSNGRMVHEMYLFRVKGPEESQYPWDYYKLLARIPGVHAFASPSESGCPVD